MSTDNENPALGGAPSDGAATQGNGNGNGNGKRKIQALRELQRDKTPPRDLWPDIQARLAQESPAAVTARPVLRRGSHLRIVAAAAVVAALAVGVWIGRYQLTSPGQPTLVANSTSSAPSGAFQAIQAAYQPSAKYARDRAALVKSLETKLNSLPPDTRAKVVASLKTIQKSRQDLEAALGHDPTNALLQELLVDTYQDEMRVLTAVHESDANGKGI